MDFLAINNIGSNLFTLFLAPLFMSFTYYIVDLLKGLLINFRFTLDIDELYDYFYKNSTSIHFEICLTRLAHNIKIESDDGYNALRYYIFNNYKNVKGIRGLKKIPIASTQALGYDDSGNPLSSDNFDKEFFKDLYLHTNKITLPNGLTINSKFTHLKSQGDKSSSHYDIGEKFIFKINLNCNLYPCPSKNLDYLIKKYTQILKDYNKYREYKDNNTQYCFIYDSHLKETPYFNQLYIGDEYRGFDSIFFKEKRDLVCDIENFIDNPEYYYHKGKPYRKIILTYGEPGCGKTSIILGILSLLAKKYNQRRHLINLNLNHLTKKNLQNIFFNEEIYVNNTDDGKKIIPFNQRIYYIEEIDNFTSTHKRQEEDDSLLEDLKEMISNKEKSDKKLICSDVDKMVSERKNKDKLTIQDLLELFDGPLSLKNSEIIIMTTNCINKIDKALLRPGRVNNLIKLGKSRKQDIIDIIEFYYEEDIPSELKNTIKSNVYTPAYISEACLKNDSPAECLNYIHSHKNNYQF